MASANAQRCSSHATQAFYKCAQQRCHRRFVTHIFMLPAECRVEFIRATSSAEVSFNKPQPFVSAARDLRKDIRGIPVTEFVRFINRFPHTFTIGGECG